MLCLCVCMRVMKNFILNKSHPWILNRVINGCVKNGHCNGFYHDTTERTSEDVFENLD